MLICLLSAKGSPGVTTTALALAFGWPRPVVVAELDPAGGDVLAGYGRGELAARGLDELALAARHGNLEGHLAAALVHLDEAGRVRLLPGLADAGGARHLDWTRVADALSAADGGATDALADCGRLGAEHFPLLVARRAAAVVVVTGSSLRAVRATSRAIAELRRELGARGADPGSVAALVVGAGEPYGEPEIADALGIPVLGGLPRDARSAGVLSDGAPAGRWFAQSPLLRAARSIAARTSTFAADCAHRREELTGHAEVPPAQAEVSHGR